MPIYVPQTRMSTRKLDWAVALVDKEQQEKQNTQ